MNNQIAPDRVAWKENFPRVMINEQLGGLKKHPEYDEAKNGNINAAIVLVSKVININAINENLSKILLEKTPLLVPVHAEEEISINRIPLAYAIVLGRAFNLPVELNIVQSAKVSRTGVKNGFLRLAFPPPFNGSPSNVAQYAVIIDDTITQGGTLANLHGYIAKFGIETIAATTLTGKDNSSLLALTDTTLQKLRDKCNEIEEWWVDYFGYGFECLTESEAKFLVSNKENADGIRNSILKERQT